MWGGDICLPKALYTPWFSGTIQIKANVLLRFGEVVQRVRPYRLTTQVQCQAPQQKGPLNEKPGLSPEQGVAQKKGENIKVMPPFLLSKRSRYVREQSHFLHTLDLP